MKLRQRYKRFKYKLQLYFVLATGILFISCSLFLNIVLLQQNFDFTDISLTCTREYWE